MFLNKTIISFGESQYLLLNIQVYLGPSTIEWAKCISLSIVNLERFWNILK
jgi:hypothetical protein